MANVGDLLITEARKHLGKSYVWATSGPTTFDCSGFTYYVTKQVQPSYVIYQGTESQRHLGTVVSLSNARPGDFVFYVDPPGSSTIIHVGFYVSPKELIHSKNEGSGVVIDNGISGYWFAERLYQVRRLFPYDDAQAGGATTPPTGGTSYMTNDLIKVFEGPLNLRSGAGTTHPIVASLATGTRLCVTGTSVPNGGYEWIPVKITDTTTTGWIAKQFTGLLTVGGCTAAPSPPPPAPTYNYTNFPNGHRIKCVDGPVNLRSSVGGTIIGSIAHGAIITVNYKWGLSGGYVWYNVNTGSQTGFCAGNFFVSA